MMNEEDQLPVSFFLDVCEVALLTAVKLHLVFYEVNHLDEATLHFEEELLLEEDGLLEVLLVEAVNLVLFASFFEGLALLFRHLWLFVGFLVILYLQHVIPHKIVVLLHIRDRVQHLGIKYLTDGHSLKLILDLLHEIHNVLLQTITDKVLHNRKLHLVLDAVRHLKLVGLPQHLFQEVYLEFLVEHLEEDGHEGFDDRVFLEVAAWETSEIEVVVAVEDVQVELFRDGVVQDLGTVLILDVSSYGRPEDHSFFIFIFFDPIKNRVVEELMPIDPRLLRILQHTSDQLHQFIGDLHAAGRHLVLKLETHLQEFILTELILKREGEVDHPIQRHTERVYIALVCIAFLEAYLRRCRDKSPIMLLVEGFSFLEELFAEPKISDLEHIIIHKYIFRFDIPMYDIEFIEILECIEYLLEVPQDILFLSYPTLTIQYPEVIIQILVIAILQDQVYPMILSIPDDILYLDDIWVMSQPDQRFDLLPCECYNLIDLLDLLNVVGDADDLECQFVDTAGLLVLVVADVDAAVGAFAQHEGFVLGVVVAELAFSVGLGRLADYYAVVWASDYVVVGVDVAVAVAVFREGLLLHLAHYYYNQRGKRWQQGRLQCSIKMGCLSKE